MISGSNPMTSDNQRRGSGNFQFYWRFSLLIHFGKRFDGDKPVALVALVSENSEEFFSRRFPREGTQYSAYITPVHSIIRQSEFHQRLDNLWPVIPGQSSSGGQPDAGIFILQAGKDSVIRHTEQI